MRQFPKGDGFKLAVTLSTDRGLSMDFVSVLKIPGRIAAHEADKLNWRII